MAWGWARIARFLGLSITAASAVAGAGAVDPVAPAAAQSLNYRKPGAVPPAWQHYAQLIQHRIGEWMAEDDEVVRRFHVYLENRVINEPDPPDTLVIRIWVTEAGKVSRAEFKPLADAQASADLRTILERGSIGEAPPPDMLQPLHLKIALKWKG